MLSYFILTFVYEDQEVDDGTVFNPSFPVRADLISSISNDSLFSFKSTCPYVTSVGATQMKPGSTVNDPEVAAMVSSGLTKGAFYSGGGFSNVFPSDCYLFDILSRTLTRSITQVA